MLQRVVGGRGSEYRIRFHCLPLIPKSMIFQVGTPN